MPQKNLATLSFVFATFFAGHSLGVLPGEAPEVPAPGIPAAAPILAAPPAIVLAEAGGRPPRGGGEPARRSLDGAFAVVAGENPLGDGE